MNKENIAAQGMYLRDFEHDSCGIGFVAHLKGKKSHSIIAQGLDILRNMTHRGAEGADKKTGDGAGVMIQVPRDFYLIQGYALPPEGQFGTGMIFLPGEPEYAEKFKEIIIKLVKDERSEEHTSELK